MTINEIIEELEESKDYPASDPASEEALDGAIDIMRKYQRIVEIVDTWYDKMLEAYDSIRDIIDVIEEGEIQDDNSTVDNSSM